MTLGVSPRESRSPQPSPLTPTLNPYLGGLIPRVDGDKDTLVGEFGRLPCEDADLGDLLADGYEEDMLVARPALHFDAAGCGLRVEG